jgi:hypothetical protein
VLVFSFTAWCLCLFNSPATFAQDVYLCVWRNPERTMTRIFPDAKDYKTVTLDISAEDRDIIETELGYPLLPGQEKRFLYYDMLGTDGTRIGTIIAASQKGEYGIVELVFGLDTALIIKDVYVQRARERDRTFKKREFLDLFKGLTVSEANQPDTPGTKAVIRGITKELAAYRKLAVELQE